MGEKLGRTPSLKEASLVATIAQHKIVVAKLFEKLLFFCSLPSLLDFYFN
jgi:hypothetical protein